MKLFFITADDSNGISMDAFVIAGHKAEALVIWAGLDFVTESVDPMVFIVPAHVCGEARALNWHFDVKEA